MTHKMAAVSIIRLPLSGSKMGHIFAIEGRPRPEPGQELPADVRVVAGDYFRVVGIPLLRGRLFDHRDREDAPPAFVVNEELVRRYFAGEEPLGQRISIPWGEDITGEIVGVVGSVREAGLTEEPAPAIYRTYAQMPFPQLAVVVRTQGDPLALAQAATAAVREIDAHQPVAQVRTLEEVVAASVARPRFNLYLLGGFAGAALVLAAIGLYGVISFAVAQRKPEIALRVALGASHREVLRLVLRQGLGVVAAGLAIGLGIALIATRLMSSLLFGVTPADPQALAAAAVFLTAVALLASWLPARRAMRVSPTRTLSGE